VIAISTWFVRQPSRTGVLMESINAGGGGDADPVIFIEDGELDVENEPAADWRGKEDAVAPATSRAPLISVQRSLGDFFGPGRAGVAALPLRTSQTSPPSATAPPATHHAVHLRTAGWGSLLRRQTGSLPSSAQRQAAITAALDNLVSSIPLPLEFEPPLGQPGAVVSMQLDATGALLAVLRQHDPAAAPGPSVPSAPSLRQPCTVALYDCDEVAMLLQRLRNATAATNATTTLDPAHLPRVRPVR